MRVKLKLIRDSDKSRVFDVSVPQFVIGRGEGCQLRPNSDAVSRRHCAILLQDDKVVVRDMGSRNGTCVNDLPIGKKEETLVTGDKLQIGPLKFEVTITDDSGVVNMPTDSRLMHQMDAEEEPGDSGLISQWLLAADKADENGNATNPETRQFQLDAAADEEDTDGSGTVTLEGSKKGSKKGSKNKKQPGKLPPRPQETTANTREAAADTLRKLFTRGS